MSRKLFSGMAVLFVCIGVAAALENTPGSLEKAAPGQWAVHRTTTNLGAETPDVTATYQWVARVDRRKVTLRSQPVSPDGKKALAEASEIVIDLDAEAFGAKPTTTPVELEIKGVKISCDLVETKDALEPESKARTLTWLSDQVPVRGIVKRDTYDRDGKLSSRTELLDWGESGGAEKPFVEKK
jgi:hypothetical protein